MKRQETIAKIMSKVVVTLNVTQTLEEAERLMKTHHIRHIPVVAKKDVIGMLSLTDLLRISFVEAYEPVYESVDTEVYAMYSVEQLMVKNPTLVNSSKTIKEVAEILSHNEFHALPVVDDHKLKGIVTTTDLLNYLCDLIEED
ncbi:CBS domain-containing protein [Flavicella sediminum]|uniref:CBS domain-containing protein n=1 Tax=Flavicella sediminum TaxID=2585141 RepID=UPI001123A01F|nr:CBS domain-containing protein [Flavicella sediminum]